MELREFAERVLFAEMLEDKIAPPPAALTDEHPGQAIATPEEPGRPVELRFHRGRRRESISEDLRDDEDRGRLLHFFGNHELLAAELMALVLLKFPDAPAAFRRGVARTLMEEQEHTRLYMERMARCGVAFGSQPVNGFFWKSIACMETPMDYVSRLSLTFEQANLDFSKHFSQVFGRSGDAESAALLERIHQDEIGHVRYGLHWFRRWKAEGLSDWEDYQRRIPYPLSPARAKGRGLFHRESRRLAGLDEDFVERLEIYSQSKGRTPNVYYFNPHAEAVIGHWPRRPSLPEKLLAVAKDLSSLNLFLALREDLALLHERPSFPFLRELARAGLAIPEIATTDTPPPEGRRLAKLRPWAWSPDSLEFFQNWLPQCSVGQTMWRPAWRSFHSKAFSVELLRDLLPKIQPWVGLMPEAIVGQSCDQIGEVEECLARWPRPVVLKAAFGVAGRGHMLVREAELREEVRRWAETVLAEEKALVVEPWLDRVMDFSVQYEVSEPMRVKGFTRLHNDARGQFRACSVERRFSEGCSDEVLRFFHAHRKLIEHFYRETLPEALGPLLAAEGFAGPLGVDAMLFRDQDGQLRHQPIVEINPRVTMGRVALDLARQTARGKRVIFEVLTKRHWRGRGVADFPALAEQIRRAAPVTLAPGQNGEPRIAQGAVILNDPSQARICLAVMRVGDLDWRPE